MGSSNEDRNQAASQLRTTIQHDRLNGAGPRDGIRIDTADSYSNGLSASMESGPGTEIRPECLPVR